MKTVDDYSPTQIGLHWAVVALVLIQYVASGGIESAWDAARDGTAVATPNTAWLHIGTGLTIFVLAIWRVVLRFTRGAPPPPPEEPKPLRWLASGTHALIYVLLIGMPISGSVAWFAGVGPAAGAHVLAKTLLLVLIGLHVAGALTQHLVFKSKVLPRMLP